jgi:hypothetical protein
LAKFALKLTKYLYRTWLSPSTLSTPCAPDSKHNNALHLPPALILPLRFRHGAGLRIERGSLQTKKKLSHASGLPMACALSVFDLALASALKSSQFPHPTGLLKAFTFSGIEKKTNFRRTIFSLLRTHERRLGAVVGTKKSSGRAMLTMNEEHVHLVSQFYSK